MEFFELLQTAIAGAGFGAATVTQTSSKPSNAAAVESKVARLISDSLRAVQFHRREFARRLQ
jgi:hypothetical protein